MSTAATKHARNRLTKRCGLTLTHYAWSQIVDNAKAGVYETRKPRPRPQRCHDRRRRWGKRLPLFLVTIVDESGLALRVPMVINLAQSVVVTVLEPEFVS